MGQCSGGSHQQSCSPWEFCLSFRLAGERPNWPGLDQDKIPWVTSHS